MLRSRPPIHTPTTTHRHTTTRPALEPRKREVARNRGNRLHMCVSKREREKDRNQGNGSGWWGWVAEKSASFEQTCEQKPTQTVGPEAWGVYGFCIYNQQIKASPLSAAPSAASLYWERQIRAPSIWVLAPITRGSCQARLDPVEKAGIWNAFIRGKKEGQVGKSVVQISII